MSLADYSQRVVIILVEPQHSGNIGGVARAMKNMGLGRLTLVNPASFDPLHAGWMSPGCEEILGDARIVNTLEESLEGIQRVVASTARHRKNRQTVHSPQEIAHQVCAAPEGITTGILFGREDSGLSTEAVLAAESIVQIPTSPHASLNLSQAVMVISHELFQAYRSQENIETGRLIHGRQGTVTTSSLQTTTARERPADWKAMENSVTALVHLLDWVGYTKNTSSERVGLSARHALQKARPTLKQIDILRGMLRQIERALEHPEK